MKTMKRYIFIAVVISCSENIFAQTAMQNDFLNSNETEVFIDGKFSNRYRNDSSAVQKFALSRGAHEISFIKKACEDFSYFSKEKNILVCDAGLYQPLAHPSLELLAGMSLLTAMIQLKYLANTVLTFE
jgi:hypothetical protein